MESDSLCQNVFFESVSRASKVIPAITTLFAGPKILKPSNLEPLSVYKTVPLKLAEPISLPSAKVDSKISISFGSISLRIVSPFKIKFFCKIFIVLPIR